MGWGRRDQDDEEARARAGQARKLALGVHSWRALLHALACTFASKISGAVAKKNWSAQKSGVQKHTPGDQRESAANKDSLFGVYFCTPAACIFRTPNFWGQRKKLRRSGNLGRPMTSFVVPSVSQVAQPVRAFVESSRA